MPPHDSRPAGLVTAYNPRGRRLADSANELRQGDLKRDLAELGLAYREVPGGYAGLPEKSLLVPGAPLGTLLRLARSYGQEAVGYREGGVWRSVQVECLVEHSTATKPKTGLYPPLYTQYYHYPPADIVTWSADAIAYLDPEDLVFRVSKKWFTPIIRKSIGDFGKGRAQG